VNNNHIPDKKENKSEVENTLTFGCFLNAFSLDQIGKSNLNANAKYSRSFGCGASFNPSDNSIHTSVAFPK